ncbi:hypothetical protein HMPREF0497_0842 [Lentilactobacillus buchneri ATCC 11577]|uniref:Uncharacterized protein n=1 Tax=Lentilactobacillus hilgardii (strain ATCC 8290 / DSM 20176 / CCUG 30140 / JCM 1155 / KCTC 3500 / NBRC 15886 / NCIMB 8040 / NRRL B-1843 / 9) TaxID=1423757 RepID=C0XK71_LENH9|nr:hypothetical protein HMPREF0497_0842 [Lentilactobacillus buchneri ATCC 11577]EEI24255.1 hypothetical protein HMPREF0519_1632 [Lentilactobacillus hilgardii DSM 20176 = ATCC 8290]
MITAFLLPLNGQQTRKTGNSAINFHFISSFKLELSQLLYDIDNQIRS